MEEQEVFVAHIMCNIRMCKSIRLCELCAHKHYFNLLKSVKM